MSYATTATMYGKNPGDSYYQLSSPGIIQGNLEITGNLKVDGTTELVGPATCDSNLVVQGDETVAGNCTVSGDIGAQGKLNVGGLLSGNNAVFSSVLQAGTLTAMDPASGKVQIASTNTVNKTLIVNDTTGTTSITNINPTSSLYGPIVVHAQSDGVAPGVLFDVAQNGPLPNNTPGYVQVNGNLKIANKLFLGTCNDTNVVGVGPTQTGQALLLWDFGPGGAAYNALTQTYGIYNMQMRYTLPGITTFTMSISVMWNQGILSGLNGASSWNIMPGAPSVYGYALTAPYTANLIGPNGGITSWVNAAFYVAQSSNQANNIDQLYFYNGIGGPSSPVSANVISITRLA